MVAENCIARMRYVVDIAGRMILVEERKEDEMSWWPLRTESAMVVGSGGRVANLLGPVGRRVKIRSVLDKHVTDFPIIALPSY